MASNLVYYCIICFVFLEWTSGSIQYSEVTGNNCCLCTVLIFRHIGVNACTKIVEPLFLQRGFEDVNTLHCLSICFILGWALCRLAYIQTLLWKLYEGKKYSYFVICIFSQRAFGQ